MPKITKEDLRRDLFLARRVIESLSRKEARLEEMVALLKDHVKTNRLNARTICILTEDSIGGWSDDSE